MASQTMHPEIARPGREGGRKAPGAHRENVRRVSMCKAGVLKPATWPTTWGPLTTITNIRDAAK